MCKLCEIEQIIKAGNMPDNLREQAMKKLGEVHDALELGAKYVAANAPAILPGYMDSMREKLGVPKRAARKRGPLDLEAAVAASFLGAIFGGKFEVQDGNGPAVTILDLNDREPGESPLDFLARKLGEG